MMRWKYIELPKGEYPQQIATKHGNGWVILQQQITERVKLCYENGEFSNYAERNIWLDVPLHIEKSDK